jgi:hypothetical protein
VKEVYLSPVKEDEDTIRRPFFSDKTGPGSVALDTDNVIRVQFEDRELPEVVFAPAADAVERDEVEIRDAKTAQIIAKNGITASLRGVSEGLGPNDRVILGGPPDTRPK